MIYHRTQAASVRGRIASLPSVAEDSKPATFPQPVSAPARPAYQRAFGFQRNPFPVVPDATGFYLSRASEAIVAEVLHAIESRKGFMVMTGEVGLGKTTLSRRILMELEERGVRTALVFNTFHQGADLLREINRDFALEVEADDFQAQMAALNDFLLTSLESGVNCAIIIDDAQQLSVESLELLRQVSNLETDSEKLVQILLIGQPELDDKLESHELRQLASRIVLRHRVEPFTLDETTQYVQFKIVQAAGHGRLQVTPGALRLLHRASGGNPRQINILMDRCLYGAIAFGTEKIDRRLMASAVKEARSDGVRRSGISAKVVFLSAGALLLAGAVGLALSWPVAGESLAGLLSPTKPVDKTATMAETAAPEVSETPPVPEPIEAAYRETVPAATEPVEAASEVGETEAPGEPVTPDPIEATDAPDVIDASLLASVDSFLAAYGLEGHAAEFERALAAGWMDEIDAKIRRSTGLRLVRLETVPEGVFEPVFELGDSGAGTDGYLLFWRPRIWSPENFYFRYRDLEVRALQGALQMLGHYSGEVDGLPGPQTSTALRRFQSAMSLEPTGLPDTTTLFLLELASGAGASEAASQEFLQAVSKIIAPL